MRWVTVALLALIGCGDDDRVSGDAGRDFDATMGDSGVFRPMPTDGGAFDAGRQDAGRQDAGRQDAERQDAGRQDAGPDAGPDAGQDAGTLDAGTFDSGPLDGGPEDPDAGGIPDGAVRLTIESAPAATPLSSGSALSEQFWPGWRFEVPPPGLDVDRVGFIGRKSGDGPLFAAFVALTGPSGRPENANLEGPDRVAFTTFDPGRVFPASEIVFDFRARLEPGWYAIVFGSGSATFGSPPTAVGNVTSVDTSRTPGAQGTFTLRQSDGAFILQSGTRRIYVSGFQR